MGTARVFLGLLIGVGPTQNLVGTEAANLKETERFMARRGKLTHESIRS